MCKTDKKKYQQHHMYYKKKNKNQNKTTNNITLFTNKTFCYLWNNIKKSTNNINVSEYTEQKRKEKKKYIHK